MNNTTYKPARSCAQINRKLKPLDIEIVNNRDGYSYFVHLINGDQVGESVSICYINQCSVQEWVAYGKQALAEYQLELHKDSLCAGPEACVHCEKLAEDAEIYVEFVRCREGEEPFHLNGANWQFVTVRNRHGNLDIGVYSREEDRCYKYSVWRQQQGLDPRPIV